MQNPTAMAPPPLDIAKNKWTSFLIRLRRKLANVKAICNVPEALELDRLSTTSERLADAWQKYKISQMDVLGFVAEDKLVDEQVTFIKMEETSEATIEEANEIIRNVSRTLQPERTVREQAVSEKTL